MMRAWMCTMLTTTVAYNTPRPWGMGYCAQRMVSSLEINTWRRTSSFVDTFNTSIQSSQQPAFPIIVVGIYIGNYILIIKHHVLLIFFYILRCNMIRKLQIVFVIWCANEGSLWQMSIHVTNSRLITRRWVYRVRSQFCSNNGMMLNVKEFTQLHERNSLIITINGLSHLHIQTCCFVFLRDQR